MVPLLLGVLCLGFGAATPWASAVSAGSIQGDVNCSGAADTAGCVDAAGGDIVGPLQGDVTCDEAVGVDDAIDVLRGVARLETTDSFCLSDAGDVDCDNHIDIRDALSIFRFAAGIAPTSITGAPGCSLIGAALVHPPTSEHLIAAALEAGDITNEQSLLYRAYALYDLPGLPDEFRSETIDYHAALELFTEVVENESTLSPGLLEQLAPFRARPADPISIFNNPPGAATVAAPAIWHSLSAGGGQARVWVKDGPGWDYDLATYAAEVTRVWTPLGSIFRRPIPDTPGAANVNPDSAIDIYFVDVGTIDPRKAGCAAVPTPPNCALTWAGAYTGYTAPQTAQTSSAYVMVATGQSGPRLTYVLAHELMHAGQHAYDFNEALWIKDATATWGGFRVLQDLGETRQELYGMAGRFFTELDQPLTLDTGYLDEQRYRRWLFFLFASMEKGDSIVTKIWEKAAAMGVQNAQAVDQAFPFATNFDDFAVRNWNMKPPLLKWYRDADNTFPTYLAPKTKPYPIYFNEEHTESDSIPPLASVYYDYKFGDLVHKVKFTNLITGHPTGRIWALIKTPQGWKDPLELTNTAEKLFCRDLATDNVSELVIIVSNSDMTAPLAGSKFKLKSDVESCHGWVGTATGTYLNEKDYYQRSITTADAVWEEEFLLYGCNCRTFIPQGSISWSWGYDDANTDPPCHDRATAHKSAPVQGVGKFEQALTFWQDPVDANRLYFSALGLSGISHNSSCQIGGSAYVPQYINLPVPKIPFPSGSPTPFPIPSFPFTASSGSATGAPGSKPKAAPAAASNLCEDQVFTITKDTVFFSGNCYESKDDTGNMKYEWSFSRVNVDP